jgi:hypothetical protein
MQLTVLLRGLGEEPVMLGEEMDQLLVRGGL